MTSCLNLDSSPTTAETALLQQVWQRIDVRPGMLPETDGLAVSGKEYFRVEKESYMGIEVFNLSRRLSSTPIWEKSLEGKIYSKLFFPPHWEEDGVAKPNEAAKLGAFAVCKSLLGTYGLIPDRIVSSIEGGVYISYTEKRNEVEKTLAVEVYNTSEVAALVNLDSERRILYSEDIRDMRFEKVMKVFRD